MPFGALVVLVSAVLGGPTGFLSILQGTLARILLSSFHNGRGDSDWK